MGPTIAENTAWHGAKNKTPILLAQVARYTGIDKTSWKLKKDEGDIKFKKGSFRKKPCFYLEKVSDRDLLVMIKESFSTYHYEKSKDHIKSQAYLIESLKERLKPGPKPKDLENTVELEQVPERKKRQYRKRMVIDASKIDEAFVDEPTYTISQFSAIGKLAKIEKIPLEKLLRIQGKLNTLCKI